ncbi:alpha/beta hydrolase [Streptomyces sp. UH6]|uniref:RBBP9/YdeN family alpha/beta hydrolase n=1 Tax=Streptomyces sp. UH6 TaxID=2748379 RepID=UPI0015D4A12B|nr:alpha/beta hydrolase [Streptomyces sp. UH6]NYV77103.1 alpha/beta hydrolase [Streptomyces sp. UH6]
MSDDSTPEQGFLILHGWQNRRPADHWQHWLADRLTELGHEVVYPQLPDPDEPRLDVWLTEYGRHLATLRARHRTVLCHSLACPTWLHAVARGQVTTPVDRVLLIAPPGPAFLADHPEITPFTAPPVTAAELGAAARRTRVVCGDDDPYCVEGAENAYAGPLGVPADVLPGTAHLNPASGYGPWSGLLDWCLAPTGDRPVAAAR